MNELPKHPNLFASEIITFTRYSKTLIYQLLECGKIPSRKVSGVYRIDRTEFLEWWEKQRVQQDLESV